ncbi:ABC transporter [Candidatus Magnetoovum chiemensis]|nr:ABC transporter [Candidatus Magnetoovum chiemensis]
MTKFLEILHFEFVQRALISGIFIAVCCAVLGVFLVLRRYSLIGDGLAHVSFAGVGLGLMLGIYPLYVVVVLALLSSWLILHLSENSEIHGDAAIGLVSSVGVAGGVLLASVGEGFNVPE